MKLLIMQSSQLPSYLCPLHNNDCSSDHEAPYHAVFSTPSYLSPLNNNDCNLDHEAPYHAFFSTPTLSPSLTQQCL